MADSDVSHIHKPKYGRELIFYGTAAEAMDISGQQVHLWRIGCESAMIIGVLPLIGRSLGAFRYNATMLRCMMPSFMVHGCSWSQHGAGLWVIIIDPYDT